MREIFRQSIQNNVVMITDKMLEFRTAKGFGSWDWKIGLKVGIRIVFWGGGSLG